MTIGNGVEGLSKREFSALLLCCQVSGGLTGHGGGQTGPVSSGFAARGWRSDRPGRRSDRPVERSDRRCLSGQTGHCMTLDFGAGPKIEGVGK